MLTLEEMALDSQISRSATEKDLNWALQMCYHYCGYDFENKDPITQHGILEGVEVFNIRGPNLRENNIYQLAYSLLMEYHTKLFEEHKDAFTEWLDSQEKKPFDFDTKLYDLNHFVAMSDVHYKPVGNIIAKGSRIKALGHFEKAYSIWPTIEDAHILIPYRHARHADICYFLHSLKKCDDNHYLDEALNHLTTANRIIHEKSEDLTQVIKAGQRIRSMLGQEVSDRYDKYTSSIQNMLSRWEVWLPNKENRKAL